MQPHLDQALASLRIETKRRRVPLILKLDQALASLRIETIYLRAGVQNMMIRLSRACGLKQFQARQRFRFVIDQALASLRIET